MRISAMYVLRKLSQKLCFLKPVCPWPNHEPLQSRQRHEKEKQNERDKISALRLFHIIYNNRYNTHCNCTICYVKCGPKIKINKINYRTIYNPINEIGYGTANDKHKRKEIGSVF